MNQQAIYYPLGILIYLIVFWQLPERVRTPVSIGTGFAVLCAFDIQSAMILAVVVFTTLAAVELLTKYRKFAYVIGMAAGLGPLVFFKIDFSQLQGGQAPPSATVLPIGLSYFSLTMLGVFLDFSRSNNKEGVAKNRLLAFGFMAPFFSYGPIERWRHLAPQLEAKRYWSRDRAASGIELIALGLFKKLVIADRLGKPYEDFRRIALSLEGAEIGVFLIFAFIQIFCDFSALIDITRGIGKLIGIDLTENFNQPYFAVSVSDIWKRWHISLVEWVRDFIYTPIALRTKNLYLATFIVMLAVGLWHAVSWNYFCWALYWTTLYCVGIFCRKKGVRIDPPWILRVIGMIFAMSASAVFFIPRQLHEVERVFANLTHSGFNHHSFLVAIEIGLTDLTIALGGFTLVVGIETFDRKIALFKETKFRRLAFWYSLTVATMLFIFTVAFAVDNSIAFIYMRY